MIGITIGVTSSAIGLKIFTITAGTKKYKSIIKKKKKNMIEISKLNRIGAIISKALTDSNTSHIEFVLMNNVLK